MTTSDVRTAARRRDAAHRRVQRVTLGVAAVVVGATSVGTVALAQAAAGDVAATPINHQSGSNGSTGSGVSAGTGLTPATGQAPVASSGGS